VGVVLAWCRVFVLFLVLVEIKLAVAHLERARLFPSTIDGDVGSRDGLANEVGHHSSIKRVHVWPICVENANDLQMTATINLSIRVRNSQDSTRG